MRQSNPISQPKLGQRLYDIRTEKGLTQLELRERSHVSVRTIQRIESGAVTPRTVTIKILLEALGENVEEWFGPHANVESPFSTKTFKNMLLVSASESELKNALSPAWIAGIVYLLMVLMESGLGAFSDYLNEGYLLMTTMVMIKFMAGISFVLFTRGILSLSLLFENNLLKVGAYLSMSFTFFLYVSEAVIILFTAYDTELAGTFRALAVVPLGAISIFLGMGLLRLQDGMGRIAKVAGRLEIVFGVCYMTLIFSFIGVLLLAPLLIVEIVLLSKAEQLARAGEL